MCRVGGIPIFKNAHPKRQNLSNVKRVVFQILSMSMVFFSITMRRAGLIRNYYVLQGQIHFLPVPAFFSLGRKWLQPGISEP